MNRRGFLTLAAAAFALDHERLLWVPGRKVYSIPTIPSPIMVVPGPWTHTACIFLPSGPHVFQPALFLDPETVKILNWDGRAGTIEVTRNGTRSTHDLLLKL